MFTYRLQRTGTKFAERLTGLLRMDFATLFLLSAGTIILIIAFCVFFIQFFGVVIDELQSTVNCF